VELAVQTGHSRLIVHDGDLDHVLGLVHVQAVHRVPYAERASTAVSELMRPILAVPESRGLDDVLVDLRRANSHMAVVVDEYGGTAGIITIEDVLEEIVGDIEDEHDPVQEQALRPGRTGEWLLEGTLHPDEVMEQTELVLPEGEYETLAGFILDQLGHIPFVGEAVELDDWRFIVTTMEKRRIAEVRVLAPNGPKRAGNGHTSDGETGGSGS
jgi:CBS domain containing-hemolysin-like protein